MNVNHCASAALFLGLLSGGAQAALVDRGNGLIYDTAQNLTWLADMNYASTSGDSQGGFMTWVAADTWANNLSYGGFDDWRLPTLNAGDSSCRFNFDPGDGFGVRHYGYDCTGGELSHLFVADLGNKADESVLDQTGDTAVQIANLALFANVQPNYGYWSNPEQMVLASEAWYFGTDAGFQNLGYNKELRLFAVAVRPGDVAATVPEPQALWLLGLGAMVLARRRRPV